jgi:hypothetical protein
MYRPIKYVTDPDKIVVNGRIVMIFDRSIGVLYLAASEQDIAKIAKKFGRFPASQVLLPAPLDHDATVLMFNNVTDIRPLSTCGHDHLLTADLLPMEFFSNDVSKSFGPENDMLLIFYKDDSAHVSSVEDMATFVHTLTRTR